MKETIDYLLIPCLIGGAITVTGFIIGMYKPKISGVILLFPLPISISLGLILILNSNLSLIREITTMSSTSMSLFLIGIPVLIGAILLLVSKSQGAKSGNK